MLKSLCSYAMAVALTACTIPNQITPGTPRDEVIARIGQPTRAVPLSGGGQRLQYSL